MRVETEGFSKGNLSGFRDLVQIVTGIKQDIKVCSDERLGRVWRGSEEGSYLRLIAVVSLNSRLESNKEEGYIQLNLEKGFLRARFGQVCRWLCRYRFGRTDLVSPGSFPLQR